MSVIVGLCKSLDDRRTSFGYSSDSCLRVCQVCTLHAARINCGCNMNPDMGLTTNTTLDAGSPIVLPYTSLVQSLPASTPAASESRKPGEEIVLHLLHFHSQCPLARQHHPKQGRGVKSPEVSDSSCSVVFLIVSWLPRVSMRHSGKEEQQGGRRKVLHDSCSRRNIAQRAFYDSSLVRKD